MYSSESNIKKKKGDRLKIPLRFNFDRLRDALFSLRLKCISVGGISKIKETIEIDEERQTIEA